MKGLTETIAQIFEAGKTVFSGACLFASTQEELFCGACGFANRDFSIHNTVDTKFDTASVTKLFTAVAVLQLVEKGRIALSSCITDLVDLDGTAIPKDVTVGHLLTHTSGIADDADEQSGEDYAALFVDKPNYSIRNCVDFLPQFAYKEPYFPAGSDVRYNNCAFILLGLAIENCTGMDYRSYVKRFVFDACGMGDTCFRAKDEICRDAAEGYFAVTDQGGKTLKWVKNIYSFPPIGTADSGAYSTVRDLHRFLCSIRNGDLLLPKSAESMLEPQVRFVNTTSSGSLRYGFVFEFLEMESRCICMYKDGANNGVAALLSYYPQLDRSLILLSNQGDSLWAMNRSMRLAIQDVYKRQTV